MRFLAVVLLVLCNVAVGARQNSPVAEFDVASIKRNTSETRTAAPPASPYRGQFVMSWATPRAMVSMAYHDPLPSEIIGLPRWAESEHYDVVARGKPAATEEEQTAMWRALFASRLKLRVHYEQRPQAAYKLVLARADGRLGPQITPATCTPPDPGAAFIEKNSAADSARMSVSREHRSATPQEESAMMAMCHPIMAGNTLYAGGVRLDSLVITIQFMGRLDRPVVDATGLQGSYRVKLTAAPPPAGPSSPDDPPTLLSALPDQLGLKLEATTIPGQALVIDHIERPSEN